MELWMCLFVPDIFSALTTEESQKGPKHLLNGQRKALNFWNWPKSDRVRLGSRVLEGLSAAQIVTKHVCLSFRCGVAARRCQSGHTPFEAVRRDVNLKFQRPCKISTIWGTQAQLGQISIPPWRLSDQPERCLCVFEARLRWKPKIKPHRVSPKSSLLCPPPFVKEPELLQMSPGTWNWEEHIQTVRLTKADDDLFNIQCRQKAEVQTDPNTSCVINGHMICLSRPCMLKHVAVVFPKWSGTSEVNRVRSAGPRSKQSPLFSLRL